MKYITNCFKPRIILIFCFLFFLGACTKETIVNDLGDSFKFTPQEITSGIMLGDIYDTRNFASFTDIVNYNKSWYVIFRVGTQHIGGLNGEIKILKSDDAVTWKVQNIIENDSLDLRDPKFTLDSVNNELYINFFGAINNPKDVNYRVHNFIVTYSPTNGYSNPQEIGLDSNISEKFAFWRYTYHKGKTYSASFRVPLLGGYTTDDICLFGNKNNFKTYASIGKLKLGSSPDEATIRFDANDNMYFLIRREVANVALGFSKPSNYSNVTWIEDPLSVKLSSPDFLFYNNKLLICGRDQNDQKFKFFSYNLTTNKIEKKFTFPSGDETGYAGMSFNPDNKDELLMSYYVISGSSRSSIKLVRMDLKTFLQ
jgi:hypothetical protein